jgi:creatinine amidohydrolase
MQTPLRILLLLTASSTIAAQEPRTRLMDDLNWMEVGRLVPARVTTVLLPVGTLEAHGVVNNGADNTVPESLAVRIAPQVNALVAPTVKYGVTVTIGEYPGTFGISADTFERYVYEVMKGLAAAGFRNIVVLNGHGPNGLPLRNAAERVFRETDARVLVTDWWTMTADLVKSVYGTEGGHAGNNETGAVLAVRPDRVRRDLYTGPDLTTPRADGWAAYPFPSSILLYRAGEGYPDFDAARAKRYFDGTVERLVTVIRDVVGKWEKAGL